MKHLVAIAALTATFSASADPAKEAVCRAEAKYAETLQEANQVGVPLADVVEIARQHDVSPRLAIRAYKYPRLQTPDLQKKMIADFRDRIYLECIE